MTIQNINEKNQIINPASDKQQDAFFNPTNNKKENTMTDITTIKHILSLDVSTLSEEQKTAYKIQVRGYLNIILSILTTGRGYIDDIDRPTYCKMAIYLNGWLLHLDVATVEDIKREAKTTKQNLPDVYKKRFNRREWENRKDLTTKIIDKIIQESLSKLEKNKWNTNDLPTISKAVKEIKKNKPPKMEILDKGEYPLLPLPTDSKFSVVYVDLADSINTTELSNHIADNVVGFFWLDDSNLQKSFKTINDLGFVIKELACWDTSKSHNGAFTTKQQHNMVVACKGKSFRPSTFRLDSIFFEYENKDSKPIYYAEIIRQMFPNLAVLEVHKNDFKYIATDYTLGDIKSLKNK